jgi:hypothetical protein
MGRVTAITDARAEGETRALVRQRCSSMRRGCLSPGGCGFSSGNCRKHFPPLAKNLEASTRVASMCVVLWCLSGQRLLRLLGMGSTKEVHDWT